MKELRCRDAGFDCEAVVRAEGEEDVLSQVAEHARQAHGLVDLDDDLLARLRAQIKEV